MAGQMYGTAPPREGKTTQTAQPKRKKKRATKGIINRAMKK